jgi:HK97 family phage prohead protease
MERKHLDIKRDGDWIVASTPDVDRDRDRVMPMGLALDNYRKNPVLFYGHSYADPWNLIGKAAEIEQDASGLRIRAELREPASDTDPMHIIKALWESGLLRAASIGFQPLEAQPNEKGGRDIQRAELLEISLVPIPANQSALRLAAKAMDSASNADWYVPTGSNLYPGASYTTTTGGTLTINHIVNPGIDLAAIAGAIAKRVNEEPDDGETAKAAEETAAETAATSGGSGDAPGTRPPAETESGGEAPLLKADDDTTAQDEAQAELRLAAILADFVSSIRPYLSQS